MHHNYQQLDLQTLIDLLAAETEKYTRSFISGSSENEQHKATINALVEEINIRKNGTIDRNAVQVGTNNNFPCC